MKKGPMKFPDGSFKTVWELFLKDLSDPSLAMEYCRLLIQVSMALSSKAVPVNTLKECAKFLQHTPELERMLGKMRNEFFKKEVPMPLPSPQEVFAELNKFLTTIERKEKVPQDAFRDLQYKILDLAHAIIFMLRPWVATQQRRQWDNRPLPVRLRGWQQNRLQFSASSWNVRVPQ